MKYKILYTCAILVCVPSLRAGVTEDFNTITSGISGQTVSGWGADIRNMLPYGTSSFPILTDGGSITIMAAGRYNDSYDASAARAVAFSSPELLGGGADSMPALLEGAVKWASRKTTPSTITVGCGSASYVSFWSTRGYNTKVVSTTMSSPSNDLSGVDVCLLDWSAGYSASALVKINNFTAAGGGLVCSNNTDSSGPWNNAIAALKPFRLMPEGSTTGWAGGSSRTIPATSPYLSAGGGIDQLIEESQGLRTLTLEEKKTIAAAYAHVEVWAPYVSGMLEALSARLTVLSGYYGPVVPTPATPISPAGTPVEFMLMRTQSAQYDAIAPGDLFAHPASDSYPGPTGTGPALTKTISVNGNTPVDFRMNQGGRELRVDTGLYAAPGAVITVTTPASKTSSGLILMVSPNACEDQTWNFTTRTFFLKSPGESR